MYLIVLMKKQKNFIATIINFERGNTVFPELDQPFTTDEVHAAIKSLKRNKNSGGDFLLNEYFIECIDILSSDIRDVFNGILNSGFYPEKWMDGIIVPLHKNGCTYDVNNTC